MAPTKYVDRTIPEISLHDFESRIDEITRNLVDAAENVGFFCLVDHGITKATVENMFDLSARFFNQPDETKATVPFSSANNAGWEKNAQIRPSTGAVDRKESYQMQFGEGMNGKQSHSLFDCMCIANIIQADGLTMLLYLGSESKH